MFVARYLLIIFCLVSLLKWNLADLSPKTLRCISYMEDDNTLLEEDDDMDSDENKYNTGNIVTGNRYGLNSFISSELNVTSTIDKLGPRYVPYESVNIKVGQMRICPPDYTFCFSLWRQSENGTHMEKQGCWKESSEGNATCNHPECTSSAPTSRNNSLYYCCCSGNACNRNVTVVEASSLELSKLTFDNHANVYEEDSNFNLGLDLDWSPIHYVLTVIVIACVIVLIVIFSIFYCAPHSNGEKTQSEGTSLATSGPGYTSNLRNVDNLNLICMLGNGKYGTVMKGLLHNREVAVKIFPETHQQYFINERSIYSLPIMDSPALLTYFGHDERRTLEGKLEYYLVLSLAPLGCLQDWIKDHTLCFETFCGMMKSITRGLSHLHTELKHGDRHKPCVAHRDFNTRNILVKSDLTCCVSDFGFALKVFGSRYEYKGEVAEAETKSFNEVGTLRYMAPELLEGAVNLRDCETSLKQMDVYALGLVLWEVATRCAAFYSSVQIIPLYKAPYEIEVGDRPTFDQMQTLVVYHKARPLFPTGWGGTPAAKLVRDTCEDCWDHDAEARLTSLCAEERMHELSHLSFRTHQQSTAAPPLISANNLKPEGLIIDEISHNNNSNSTDNNKFNTLMLLTPPPNQRVSHTLSTSPLSPSPPAVSTNIKNGNHINIVIEKNHLNQSQSQMQPYQGRNPCLERNLAPIPLHPLNKPIQRSKKHSFQNQIENYEENGGLSSLEDDVSVEELLTVNRTKKNPLLARDELPNMGEGFPKQYNVDRNLKGWHRVRALIQERLFRKTHHSGIEVFRQINGNIGDEKSTLVDNQKVAVLNGIEKNSIVSPVVVSFANICDIGYSNNKFITSRSVSHSYDKNVNEGHKRPNNLDLSPLNGEVNGCRKSPQMGHGISTIKEEDNDNSNSNNLQIIFNTKSTFKTKPEKIELTTTHKESELNMFANDNGKNSIRCMSEKNPHSKSEPRFRRQSSLELFREIFNARGSCERLRDPSERVKTPGDIPPAVRKLRASKTLSLCDDRMMDTSSFNIL